LKMGSAGLEWIERFRRDSGGMVRKWLLEWMDSLCGL